MTEPPTQLPATEAQVYDVEVLLNNRLGRAVNDMLQQLGQRGIAITGFTPEEVEESS